MAALLLALFKYLRKKKKEVIQLMLWNEANIKQSADNSLTHKCVRLFISMKL